MGLLQPMTDTVGHMKAIFQGKQGSGKTFTAVSLACGIHQQFGCQQPVLCFDTEGGLRFHRGRIAELTGQVPLAVASRKMADLMQAVREAEDMGVEVILIDSVTHIWQGLMESYKLGLAQRFNRELSEIHLGVDDIGKIKDMWGPFARWFVETRTHVIICGRLGYDWDMVEDDRGRAQLQRVGTKAKAEGEFGYESDFAVEMELIQEEHPLFKKAVDAGRCSADAGSVALATVVKDRWDLLMGAREFNPDFEFFRPVVSRLRPRESPPIDTDPGVADLGDDGRQRWKVKKTIALENIELHIARALPGATGKDKTAKLDLFDAAFRQVSWEAIKRFSLQQLEAYVPHIREASETIREDRDKMPAVLERLRAVAVEILGPTEEDVAKEEAETRSDAEDQMAAAMDGAGGSDAAPAPKKVAKKARRKAVTTPSEPDQSGDASDGSPAPAAAAESAGG